MQTNKSNKNFIAVCIIYIVVLCGFVGLRIIAGLGWFDKMDDRAADILFNVLAQVVLMFLVPVIGMLILKRRQKSAEPVTFSNYMQGNFQPPQEQSIMKSWGFNKPSGQVIGWALLLAVLMFFFNIFVSNFFNSILALLGHRGAAMGGGDSSFSGVGGLFVMLFLGAVLPGVCEETTHRGLLMRGFASRVGIMRAVMLSSIMFGFMHLNIVQCIYAFVLGYLMALAVMATRSIWTAVIIHFFNNALSTYLSFANAYDWFGGNFFVYFSNFLGIIPFMYIIAFAGAYILIIRIIHKIARDNFVKDDIGREQPRRLFPSKGMAAVNYYLTAGEVKERTPLTALEKTLVCGILFLGGVVTLMTLVWGFM